MKQTRYLTKEEKRKGEKFFFQFQVLNGMGFTFIGDTTVYLLAIMYGASNIQLGYISSTVYFSGIILPVIPRLLKGQKYVQVLSVAWALRGFVCLGYLFLFFLEGKAAVYLILFLYTAFAVVRTTGAVMFRPVIRMISTNTNQGTIIGKADFSFNIAAIFSRGLSFFVTSYERFSGVLGLIGLQLLGVVINTAAAFRVRRIPCRETVQYRKGKGAIRTFRETAGETEVRRILFLQWVALANMVLGGLTIPFMRNRMNFSVSEVFLFSMGLALAVIIAAIFVRTFADKIGSKPLMTINAFFNAFFAFVWILLPETLGKPVYFILGVLLLFTIQTNRMLVGRLMIRGMPEEDSISFNSMVDFGVALCSLFLGIFGGFLIDLGPGSRGLLLNQYSFTFALIALLCVSTLYLVRKVREDSGMTGKDAAALLFSIDGLRAFIDIGRLQSAADPVVKKTVLLSIGSNRNNVATGEIEKMLYSPFSPEKSEMIRAVFHRPRPSLLPLLLEEAADRDSYTQEEAVFALGAYPGEETETLLLKLFDSETGHIRALAAKSLARIGSRSRLGQVRELFRNENDIRDAMNLVIALSIMDSEGKYLEELFTPLMKKSGRRFRQSLYALHADFLDFRPRLADLFQLRNEEQGAGFRDFLYETRDHPGFLGSHPELLTWFLEERFDKIADFCRKVARDADVTDSGPNGYIRKAILNCTEDPDLEISHDDILTLVYFTYQIVKPE